jgi:hypothetical protein
MELKIEKRGIESLTYKELGELIRWMEQDAAALYYGILAQREESLTRQLIHADNPETRGGIKELAQTVSVHDQAIFRAKEMARKMKAETVEK